MTAAGDEGGGPEHPGPGAPTRPARAPRPARFDAFLSYSHQDHAAALGIQRGLHRIGRRVGRLNALRVFRDSTDLTASPDLWAQVVAAIDDSRYFVLVLSPAAARSRWVQRELAHWLAHRGTEGLLLAVAGGRLVWDADERRFDPDRSTAAFPHLCRPGVFADEPLWVDISADSPWSVDSVSFRDKVAGLAAPIHGKSKYELASEDAREQRKFVVLRRAAIAGLVLLAVCALVAAGIAVDRTREALRQRDGAVALSLAAAARDVTERNGALALALGAESVEAADPPLWQGAAALVHARVTSARSAAQPLGEPLTGHTDFVQAVAVSPDGRVAASGASDDSVRLWRLPGGEPIGGPLRGHDNGVFALAFDRSGRLLASGGTDRTVRLWDPGTGAPIGVLPQPTLVHALAFAPGGGVLAVAAGGTLRLWDPALRAPRGPPLVEQIDAITSLAFSDDGATLAAGTFDNRVLVWDTATWRLRHDLATGYRYGVDAVAFRPGSQQLASCGDDTLTLWDAMDGTAVGPPHPGARNALAFSPDGRLLASAAGPNAVTLWDATTAEPVGEPLAGHTDAVSSVAFGGDVLVSGSLDDTVRLWAPRAGDPLGTTLRGHQDSVTSVAFDPAGGLLASGGFDTTIRLWDPATGAPVGSPLVGHTDAVSALSFDPKAFDPKASDPKGGRLASAGLDGSIRLWDTARGVPLGAPLLGHAGAVDDVEFSPDGVLLASAGDDATVRLWDPATGRQRGPPLAGHDDHVFAVAFSRDGTRLAAGDADGVVTIWDMTADNPRELRRLRSAAPVRGLAFSPDGTTLATAEFDNAVRLWDLTAAEPVGRALTGHTDTVYAVLFTPDGGALVSAGADGTVRLWDAGTGEPLGDPLPGHTGAVYGLAVGATGRLASASADTTVRVWDRPLSAERACELAAPFVTRGQLERYLLPGWTPRCRYRS